MQHCPKAPIIPKTIFHPEAVNWNFKHAHSQGNTCACNRACICVFASWPVTKKLCVQLGSSVFKGIKAAVPVITCYHTHTRCRTRIQACRAHAQKQRRTHKCRDGHFHCSLSLTLTQTICKMAHTSSQIKGRATVTAPLH